MSKKNKLSRKDKGKGTRRHDGLKIENSEKKVMNSAGLHHLHSSIVYKPS